MRSERLVAMGPVGCPPVAETCPASLAMAFQTSIGGARRLIGDALNLRHRLPRTWQRVTAGQIHAWKARQLAQRTAHLNPVSAREVDRLLVGHLELVAWRRFEKMLDATAAARRRGQLPGRGPGRPRPTATCGPASPATGTGC